MFFFFFHSLHLAGLKVEAMLVKIEAPSVLFEPQVVGGLSRGAATVTPI